MDKVLTRIFSTLASLVFLLVVILEVFLGPVYILFYFVTGIQGPWFGLMGIVGDWFSKFKYIED